MKERPRNRLWMWIVRLLISCLEVDWRARALDWLYSHVEKDARQSDYSRYDRPGGRYHRRPR